MELNDKIFIHSVLKRLEWKFELMGQPCPICGEAHKYGHAPDCDLNKSINLLLEAKLSE